MVMESRPRGCDHFTYVEVDNRKFRVEYDENGRVLRIKERKAKDPPMLGVYEVSRWVPSSRRMDSGLPKRIIAAAALKMKREDDAVRATP